PADKRGDLKENIKRATAPSCAAWPLVALSSRDNNSHVADLERRVVLRSDEYCRINDEFRASEDRYCDIVEAQTECIVRWLPDGTRKFVNEGYWRGQPSRARPLRP